MVYAATNCNNLGTEQKIVVYIDQTQTEESILVNPVLNPVYIAHTHGGRALWFKSLMLLWKHLGEPYKGKEIFENIRSSDIFEDFTVVLYSNATTLKGRPTMGSQKLHHDSTQIFKIIFLDVLQEINII